MKKIYKIRCRIHGIITTTEPEKHDVVWKREFTPEIGPKDKNHKNDNLINNIMKTTNAFKETIKNYLESRAKEDELFAVTYKKENKNIEGCINYILQTVQKSGCSGFEDSEIFNMAVHYYDEDSINVKGNVNGVKVIVNHVVELSEEDKAAAKQKAMKLAIEEAKTEAKSKLLEKVELTEEDMLDVKQKAMEKVVLEQKEKLVKKKSIKKVDTNTEVEPDLFS